MQDPDLSRIVETSIPIRSIQLVDYLRQLRRDVLPHLRQMETEGRLRWFSFLVHQPEQHLTHASPTGVHIHLRMEPGTDLGIEAFIGGLPAHFPSPTRVGLSNIQDVDGALLKDVNWVHGWRILGETSEWVLRLLEAHGDNLSDGQIIQFMHFLTNALSFENRCIYTPSGRCFSPPKRASLKVSIWSLFSRRVEAPQCGLR